jgi:anaerobic magnesium-protoporphyrin IX monomethyl ester cyclase
MKFLIVTPKFIRNRTEFYFLPISLGYISSSLKQKGYDVEILNVNHYDESVENLVAREIERKNVDVVCSGGLSPDFNRIKLIFDTAKKTKPNIITIVGGGLISSEPELIFKALNVNFGVLGEGEVTILELADYIVNGGDVKNINGIIYMENDKIFINPPRKPIEDLDSIAFPDYDGLQLNEYLDIMLSGDVYYTSILDKPRMGPVVTSRSCPYNCTFCYHPLGKKYRQRSLDNIFAEIEQLVKKYNINILTIYDELFSVDMARLDEFCRRIKEYNLKWTCQLRIDLVTEELLNMLKNSGCFLISYGLESASDTILKSMKKSITVPQIEKGLKLTREAKIGIRGNFIFGDIEETNETAKETIEWWLQHREYEITLLQLGIYPGSEVYKKTIEKGLIKNKLNFIKNGYPFVNITKMNDKDYHELMQLVKGYRNTKPTNIIKKKKGCHPIKGDIFQIMVECNYCHKTSEYNNVNLKKCLFTEVLCCECRQMLFIPRLYPSWRCNLIFLFQQLHEKGLFWCIQKILQKIPNFTRFIQAKKKYIHKKSTDRPI